MPVYCAIPPLDQAATRIGRGYGLGYNRARTAADQLHGGMDFVADAGSPVLAPIPGTVVLVGHDSGPGRIRGMGGYGNCVVLEHRFDVPGLPNPFWTSYNHLRAPSLLTVGQRVGTGDLIGQVGNTTNGQFAGMGSHLHFEVRRRPFPGSYERDTVDPAVLFAGLGVDVIGARREVQRMVGGQLLVREGGPSDCRAGITPTIAGLPPHWTGSRDPGRGYRHFSGRWWEVYGGTVESPSLRGLPLGAVPSGYVDPAAIRSKYESKGVSRSNQNIESAALQPPDYAAMIAANTNTGRSSTPSGGAVWTPDGGRETVSLGPGASAAIGVAAAAGLFLLFGRS